MCGLKFKGLPYVCKTDTNAGIRFFFLYFSLNQHFIVSDEALNSKFNSFLLFLKYPLHSSGKVKTTCLCFHLNNLDLIDKALSSLYLLPQEEQNLVLQV